MKARITACCLSRPARGGFSLVEIILAIGIMSVAVVGILGLFPVAVGASQDSREETQAALIARAVFADLEKGPGAKRYFTLDTPVNERSEKELDLAVNFDETRLAGFDSDGKVIGPGGASGGAIYTVSVAGLPLGTPPDRARITLKVVTARAEYPFAAVLRF